MRLAASGNLKPGQLKTRAKLYFQINLLCNSSLWVNETFQDCIRFDEMYAFQTIKHPPIQRIKGAMSKFRTRQTRTTINIARYVGILHQKNWNCIYAFVSP